MRRHIARSRSYRLPSAPFEVTTEDGLRLRGHTLGEGPVALVFCHGFLGWHRKPALVRLQESLAGTFTVFAFDFRGHGRSEGTSTMGSLEHLDVDAVVGRARAQGFERVVTLGGSMGGIAVVRQAGLLGGVDCAVAISTPATWQGHDNPAVRRLTWLTSTPAGRRALRLMGARPGSGWVPADDPLAVVDRIAPAGLLIVHGRDDRYFDESQARALYERAGEPKRLLISGHFGHAEDGYRDGFAELLTDRLTEMLPRCRARLRVGAAG